MVVLAAGFTHDPGITPIPPFCNPAGYAAVETAEDCRTSCVMETREITVRKDDASHLLGVAGDELNHIGGQTSFPKDFVDDVIGRNRRG